MAKPAKGKTAPGSDAPAKAAPGKINASAEGLNALLEAMNKKFGKNAVYAVDTQPKNAVIDVISTGSLNLDIALGIGGLPRGRIIEAYGPESSGKTTLTLHLIAEAQRQGLLCAFVDAEHALDVKYAKSLGVDLSRLLLNQPDNGEQALDVVEELCKSGQVGVVIVDSVAALTPKAELEGDMSTSHVGRQARMMSMAMRKLAAIAAKNNVLLFFINQIRMKIGITFGSPETTPGGQALKYAASVRLDIRRIGGVKTGGSETFTANSTKVTVKKNKMAPPFKEALFEIAFGTGIDSVGELLDMGKEHGFFSLMNAEREKSGNTWWYERAADNDGVVEYVKIATHREAAKEALAGMADIRAELRQRLLDKLLTIQVTATTEADRAALAAKIEAEKYIPEPGQFTTAAPGDGGDEDNDPLAQVAKYADSEEDE